MQKLKLSKSCLPLSSHQLPSGKRYCGQLAFLQTDLFRELVFGRILSLHTLAYIYFDNHHDYYQYHLPDDHYLHQGFWGLPWWSTDQDLGLSTSVQEIPQANGSAAPQNELVYYVYNAGHSKSIDRYKNTFTDLFQETSVIQQTFRLLVSDLN